MSEETRNDLEEKGIRDLGLGIREEVKGIRDLGLETRDLGLGIRKKEEIREEIPNPQSPVPNPQPPVPNLQFPTSSSQPPIPNPQSPIPLSQLATKTVALRISYDGTNFRGWQRQPRGLRTVQGCIEDVVESLVYPDGTPLDKRPEQEDWPVIEVKGSSRTDAGVHALGQVAAFRTDRAIRPRSWAGAINSRLPADIRILESWQAADEFNPIGDTKRKRYRYVIYDAKNLCGDLFLRTHSWGIRETLDLDLMRQAGEKLVGTHDFYGFVNSGGKRDDTVRTILDFSVEPSVCPRTGVALTVIEVEGTGFLYNMVRIIAGTLVFIGKGKIPPNSIDQMLEQRNRALGGVTAPPQGLFLVKIWYD